MAIIMESRPDIGLLHHLGKMDRVKPVGVRSSHSPLMGLNYIIEFFKNGNETGCPDDIWEPADLTELFEIINKCKKSTGNIRKLEVGFVGYPHREVIRLF